VSRGPGELQRRIIHELALEPGARLPWRELRSRFPRQVEDKSFFRAVRSLRKRGLVFDHYAGERRYVALTVLGDSELRDLCDAAHAQLAAVARARGVAVPTLVEPAPPERKPRASRQDVDT
jgi:hypothetical protein